jgi:hypothetical protein
MCDLGLLDPDILAKRVEAAYPWRHPKDEDEGRAAADENVKVVLNYLRVGVWRRT